MSDKRIDFIMSAACFGAAIAGVIGIVAAIMSLGSQDFMAAGVSVIGAGLAFGLLANAMLRS